MKTIIKVPAIRVQQSKGKVIFQFTVEGKELPRFAAISRIRREGNGEIAGYQRLGALAHIASIRKYIESDSPMIPNSIVIAFKKKITFVPAEGVDPKAQVQMGILEIPALASIDDEGEVIGWIVDGQQRSAAIRTARVKSFLIPVTAFVATNDSEQREQFILVNSVKPLSKSLIFELLPTMDALLPAGLARRRLAATVLDALNSNPKGPFFGKIQRPTNPYGTIKDNSVLRMLEHSIIEGVLYRYRDSATGNGDVAKMAEVVNNFFGAVRDIFPEDWDSNPRKSRLVHGVGIVSMGFLMDTIAESRMRNGIPSQATFKKEILRIADDMKWSSGEWLMLDGKKRKWNEFQNTSKDLNNMTKLLLAMYEDAK